MQRYIDLLVRPRYGIVLRNFLASLLIWSFSLLLYRFTDTDSEMMVLLGLMLPYSILQYTLTTQVILPRMPKGRRNFITLLVLVGLLLMLSAVPFALLAHLYHETASDAFGFVMGNAALQLLVMTPLAWYFYRRSSKTTEEVTHLKQELGQSEASLDFLRSQINPHFLFNALNSIYGLALNEGAQRTADGVQMLGDLMRFMIHDNQQEEIDLAREADYLQQYIRLQRLRTDGNESVLVTAHINEVPSGLRIAPMLLIPFVENAFKHGISFRTPSYINVTLDVKDGTVFLDVHNSVAPKTSDDPERDRSGIGLANVRHRLAVLYPDRHELFVRNTGTEFFVHLSIRLT
ncbi:sensor histidine kinase [Flaviaesturariibacter terrae]